MKLLFLCAYLYIHFIKNVISIYDDNFVFTFKDVKRVHTRKSTVKKFEIDIILKFNTKKTAKEFFLTSLIPANSCDYLITSKMYLLKLTTDELKKFKIHRHPFKNKEITKTVPPEYDFSEKSLKNFFPIEGTIYPSNYLLKISVEISKEGLSPDGVWILSIAERNASNEGNQVCTIYSDKIAEIFLQQSAHSNLFLLYCSSATNAELLNLVQDMRKSFHVQLSASKTFFGAHDSTYTIQMNLDQIAADLKTDKVMISIKLPIDLCYSNSCFNANFENPCLNIKANPFEQCSYTFRSHKFLLRSKRNEEISGKLEVLIENINNPLIDLESEKNWIINVYTVDTVNFSMSKEHKEILERVSHDVCSKNFINRFVDKFSDNITWVKSHIAVSPTPRLIPLKVEVITRLRKKKKKKKAKNRPKMDQKKGQRDTEKMIRCQNDEIPDEQILSPPMNAHGLLENPLVLSLKLNFSIGHIFNKCLVELQSIHRFTSAITKSENRLNIYNHSLILPNSLYKPVEEDEHKLQIEANLIKNNDVIQFAIDVKKYQNNEYWKCTLSCLNKEGKYVKEAQTLFVYPIENKKIYISNLYYKEKVEDNKYIFYLDLFIYDEKEIDIKLTFLPPSSATNSIPISGKTSTKVQLTDTCDAFMYTSCYNLVFHECSNKAEEKHIIYQMNSYKSSNKHSTIQFPLIIPKEVKEFNLLFEVDIKNNPRNVKKIMHIDVEKVLTHNAKTPCINDLVSVLKKYEKYESHLFLLFKAVNCHNIYQPFLTNFQNNANFFAKTAPSESFEKFTFQKTYKQVFPINYESISQKLFDKNIISIITIVLIDDAFFFNSFMSSKKKIVFEYLKKNIFFPYNKYYVVHYSNNNVLINLYKYIDAGNVKIDIVQKSSEINNLLAALDKTISFAEDIKEKEKHSYMNSEYSILLFTDTKGVQNVKAATNKYIKKDDDINKSFSRIYVVSLEQGDYYTTNKDKFSESIQNVDDMYIYNKRTREGQIGNVIDGTVGDENKDNILFFSFHKYITDEQLTIHYAKSILEDYILLHTQVYKTSWYLIGICRYNIMRDSITKRKLHLYYVDKNIKTVTYTISKDETKKVFDNSSLSSFQDMCNIFTQLQLLGYK
ncbi:hypothetical protein MKS88_003870 [Plasmodium brasilianum]|uniref:Uncharacterized protein n=1 Tax=Plasmodium brasilianum TaxID=5824 RepID=A0ACB9Y994_PLABR|nr:hypothetical protein MKS88_003870 [Plasmodium brasilianum]